MVRANGDYLSNKKTLFLGRKYQYPIQLGDYDYSLEKLTNIMGASVKEEMQLEKLVFIRAT